VQSCQESPAINENPLSTAKLT